jgi:formylglycine-generating enzyme required for sulfatase activity
MHSTVVEPANLLAILSDLAASLEERGAAGDALAALGDPRAVALDRIVIPEGPFLFGGSGEVGASTARSVHLSTYAIDRYPVTVAAYAGFIAAGGYRERRFWSRAGWRFRCEKALTKPRFWGEPEWALVNVPNHPVVGVSAFEAEAYAAFREARLPSEAEWEKAARGTDGRRFPWGNEWIDDACGVRGQGPRGTLSIGAYPRGKSPYGLFDVVGCVWQWCADAADDDAEPGDEDPFVDPDDYDESAKRVTKGGGWNNLQWSISCPGRNGYPPDAQFSNVGFRCALGSELTRTS